MTKNDITKKQHTVTRAYLESFANEGKLPAINLDDGRVFITSAKDACTEDYFYESEFSNAFPGKDFGANRFANPNGVENAMSKHEDRFMRAIRFACDSFCDDAVSEEDLIVATDDIFNFAMHTISRNPRALPDLVDIAKNGLSESLYDKARREAELNGRPEETEAFATERAKRFILADSEYGMLSKRTYSEWQNSRRLLLRLPREKRFVTSDFPVCGQGNDENLIALFLPLNSQVAIMFSDKGRDQAHCERAVLREDSADILNAMQMRSKPARRFLYGANCDYLSWLYQEVCAGGLAFPDLSQLE